MISYCTCVDISLTDTTAMGVIGYVRVQIAVCNMSKAPAANLYEKMTCRIKAI